jgi:4-amino-4-deoxy-L-arabinose transferase-like glycosyltransferase
MHLTPSWRLLNGPTLLLVCLAVYLPFFWQLPLMRAEAMYALIPQEMLAAGSWFTPLLNGVPYLDKPQLLYWLNLWSYQVFGVSDWAARVPTLAITLGEVWVTYLIGRRLLSREAAWLGGFVLLSCIGFFSLHLQILTDHLITLSLAASLYFLLRWQETPGCRWSALFFLCLVAGFLTKGFIGLAFPGLILLLYAWQLRQPGLIRLLLSPRGLALAALLLAPWFVGSELAHPGFLQFQLVNEQILRFLGRRQPPDITPFSLPGFWLFLGLWLLPWTLLLPQALYRFWVETRPGGAADPRARLLLIWPAVILVFFSLSSSRIEYYSLPALPPLALVLGWRLKRFLEARDRTLAFALLGLGLLGLSTLFLLPYLEQLCAGNRREFSGMFELILPLAKPATWIIPAIALSGALAGMRRRPGLALSCYGALALVLVYFTFKTLLVLAPLLSDKLPGELVKSRAATGDLLVMEQIEEFEYGASLAFYAGRPILMVRRHGLPQFPYPVPPALDYLITPEQLKGWWQGPRRVYLLLDDATPPEPFLQGAAVALALPGKRLLVNHPESHGQEGAKEALPPAPQLH